MQSFVRPSTASLARLSPASCPASSFQISARQATVRSLCSLQSRSRHLPVAHLQNTIRRPPSRHFTSTTRMSSGTFSNADTGDKPADPYKAKNLEDPSTKEKVDDLVAFVEKSKFCNMTTRIADNGLLVARCMALAGKEGNGIDLIFHANTESGKTDDLEKDPKINLSFLNASGEWASISGEASVETDRAMVHKHYSPALKAWIGDLGDGKHDGGPDDPRICAIKVKAITAQYAIARRTAVGGFVEFAKGVATGDAPSVNKLRYIDEAELSQYRNSLV